MSDDQVVRMRKFLSDALYTEIDAMSEEGEAPDLGHVEFVIRNDPDGVLGTTLVAIDEDMALFQAEIRTDKCKGCECDQVVQTMLITEEEAKAFVRVASKIWPGILE